MYVPTYCTSYSSQSVFHTARWSLLSIPAADVCIYICVCVCCFLRAQTLVDVFHAPLVRWLGQQEDTDRAGTVCCPVSRTDVAFVFSNLDELVVFSRYVCLTRRCSCINTLTTCTLVLYKYQVYCNTVLVVLVNQVQYVCV